MTERLPLFSISLRPSSLETRSTGSSFGAQVKRAVSVCLSKKMATNWLIPSPDPSSSSTSSPLSRSFSGALTRRVSFQENIGAGPSNGLAIRIMNTRIDNEKEKKRSRGRGRGTASGGGGRTEKITLWDDGHVNVSAMRRPAKAAAAVDSPLPRSLTTRRLSRLRVRDEDRQRDPIELIDDFLDDLYLDSAKQVQKQVNQAHAQGSGQQPSRRRLRFSLRTSPHSPLTPSSSSASSSSPSLRQAAVETPGSSSICSVETPTKPQVTAQQKPSFAAHRRLRIQTSNLTLHPHSPLSPALSPTPLATPDPASNDRQTVSEPDSSDSPSRLRQAAHSGLHISVHETVSKGHRTNGLRIVSTPEGAALEEAIDPRCVVSSTKPRGALYFFDSERQAIADKVNSKEYHCLHENCITCREFAFIRLENRAMSTAMPPEERQKIINANRSLRNIKNELENLSEAGMISDDIYDKIMSQLPNEMSLNASSRAAAAPTPPVNQNLNVRNDPPPPSYNSSTPQPPGLPTRTQSDTPSKPEIGRAIALYRYAEPDDCTFEVGDQIAIYEHMNNDWWFGKNVRTGKEGVFPVNYVQSQMNSQPPPSQYGPPQGAYGNEKSQNPYNGGGYQGQQYQQQGPPPPGPSNPYNAAVPPMAVAESGSSQPGKGQEMGKKFGKKLGNAAIFGAGATIGGNIVNSIF